MEFLLKKGSIFGIFLFLIITNNNHVIKSKCPEDMGYIPAGEFMIGCDNELSQCFKEELPRNKITITKPYCVDKYTVTQREFKTVMSRNPSFFKDCGEKCPVDSVVWTDAYNYCTKLGKRLLTEAEWEVIRTLIEVFSAVTSELYVYMNNTMKQAYLSTATSNLLDLKAKEYGVKRKDAVKTEGKVLFSRLLPKNVNVVIPAGSIVATGIDQSGNDKKYITTSQAVLQSGEKEVLVPVIAEHPGASYNIGSSAIKHSPWGHQRLLDSLETNREFT